MKYASLICMIALSAAVAIGCGQDEAGSGNANGGGATGGGGGPTGGTGGSVGEGACTTPDNVAVYDELDYTDADNIESSGTDAASAIAADCLRALTTNPASDGCSAEFGRVLGELPTPSAEAIDALVECDVVCLIAVTANISGTDGLSRDCADCYGGSVACGAEFCTAQCSADTNAPQCLQCREDSGCTPTFVECSGIP